MSDVRVVAAQSPARSAQFGEMTWPIPTADLGHTLRYGQPTKGQLLSAASVLDAYRALIWKPRAQQAKIISRLREAYRLAGEECP